MEVRRDRALERRTGGIDGAEVRGALGADTGALPLGMSVSNLNDIVTAINQNYDNGSTNNGYLY